MKTVLHRLRRYVFGPTEQELAAMHRSEREQVVGILLMRLAEERYGIVPKSPRDAIHLLVDECFKEQP